MVAKFKIFLDSAGKWRWHLEASGNYRIVADSGEGYETKAACQHGIDVIKKEIYDATIE
jgi:uncharacterized protein YegP (UPF0339 family)